MTGDLEGGERAAPAALPEPRRASAFGPISRMAVAMRVAGAFGLAKPMLGFLLKYFVLPWPSRKLSRYRPTSHDVFVAIDGKSGTNWALQICVEVAHRGEASFEHIHDVVPWPECGFFEMVDLNDPAPQRASPTGMRVIKTHLPSEHVPFNGEARYVTFIRDPKDLVVSAYHFVPGMMGALHLVSLHDFVEGGLRHGRLCEGWARHVAGYWARRHEPNVFVRTFNEVKADPHGTVRSLAALMGVTLSAEELERVQARSSFAYMRSIDHKFAPPRSPFVPIDQHPNMMRRGAVGESAQALTADQRARIDAGCREALALLGCDFPYDEAFGVRDGT